MLALGVHACTHTRLCACTHTPTHARTHAQALRQAAEAGRNPKALAGVWQALQQEVAAAMAAAKASPAGDGEAHAAETSPPARPLSRLGHGNGPQDNGYSGPQALGGVAPGAGEARASRSGSYAGMYAS